MRIANPIYNVVFKYLMDDQKIAKLLISKIIGEDVESIEFQPKENVVKVDFEAEEEVKASFTVYRLDFSAKIRSSEGELKQVIIEIQKAKMPTDIMRFRKYLGRQYSSENNTVISETNGRKHTKAFPIISIYFLGHGLEYETAPVIKVSRTYTDIATGAELKNREEFIESLTHDSYVIQIPQLKGKRRNELEKLLSIFDQSQKESNHILNISEDDYPIEFRDIVRKLQKAVVDEEIQNTMDVEDEILDVLCDREREIEDLKEALSEKDNVITEKDNVIVEKENVIIEKDKALVEQEKEIKRLKKMLEGQ